MKALGPAELRPRSVERPLRDRWLRDHSGDAPQSSRMGTLPEEPSDAEDPPAFPATLNAFCGDAAANFRGNQAWGV